MENVLSGIDVGSVSTDFVVMDDNLKIVDQLYLKTKGAPIDAVKEGLGSCPAASGTKRFWAWDH